jgi:hypothetical protein
MEGRTIDGIKQRASLGNPVGGQPLREPLSLATGK